MKKLYEKSEIWFAVVWIIIYVVGSSIADSVSAELGVEKSATLLFQAVLFVLVLGFIGKNSLTEYYGLCRGKYPAKKFLYYIPLALIASVNIWFGARMNLSIPETFCYVGSMLLVGFLEEIIFRGFLFKAMSRDNVRTALIVSAVTFGIGHIVNLLNGSGADLTSNLCQIVYAVAIGFLFVTIFYRGGSLWPCIITHSILNSLSVFSNETAAVRYLIPVSAALTLISLAYCLVLTKTLPRPGDR